MTQSSGHDPLCPPFNGHLTREQCQVCELIARVRDDEARRLECLAASLIVTRHDDGSLTLSEPEDPHGLGWTPVALPLVREWMAGASGALVAEGRRVSQVAFREAVEIVHSAPLLRLREADGTEYVARDDLIEELRQHARRRIGGSQ